MAALLRVLFLALPVLFTPGVHAHRHVTSAPQHACHIAGSQLVRCGGDAALGRTAFAPLASHGVSAGVNFTCALRVNGSMTCWGALPGLTRGDFDAFYWTAPDAFLDISAGDAHVCGLRYDGTLRCYGDNSAGQAAPPGGDSVRYTTVSCGAQYTCGVTRGDYTVRCFGAAAAPVVPSQLSRPAPSLTDAVVHVSSGARHACALRANGSVTCFGSDRVPSAPASVAMDWIAAGDGFSCGITRDVGSVVCVGDAPTGLPVTSGWQELSCSTGYCCGVNGDSIIACFGTAVPISTVLLPNSFPLNPSGSAIQQLAVGGYHTCVLLATASVRCYGNDFFDQLKVPAGTRFIQISASLQYTCGVTDAGAAACWGTDYDGEGSPPAFPAPAVSITAGGAIPDFHACSLLSDGTGVCWGANFNGQSDVPGQAPFSSVHAGGMWTCTLARSQVGNAITCAGKFDFAWPQLPPDRYVRLTGARDSACAERADGVMSCWGFIPTSVNVTQLSTKWRSASIHAYDGFFCGVAADLSGRASCVGGLDSNANVPPDVLGALSIGVSDVSGCALLQQGSITCWGSNSDGQADVPNAFGPRQTHSRDLFACTQGSVIGDATPYVRCYSPRDSMSFPGAQDVALGGMHACVLLTSGDVQCVAIDYPTLTFKSIFPFGPGAIPARVRSIAATATAACWSNETATSCVDASTGMPMLSVPPASFASMSGGTGHVCGVTSAGGTACWGDDTLKQLMIPAVVSDTSVTSLSAGAGHTCAVLADTTAACWGGLFTSLLTATWLRATGWQHVESACDFACGLRTASVGMTAVMCWNGTQYFLDTMLGASLYSMTLDAVDCFAAGLHITDAFTGDTILATSRVYTGVVSTCNKLGNVAVGRDDAATTWSMAHIGCTAGVADFSALNFTTGAPSALLSGLHSRVQTVDLSGSSVSAIVPGAFVAPSSACIRTLRLPRGRAPGSLYLQVDSFAGLTGVSGLNADGGSGVANLSMTGVYTGAPTSFSLDVFAPLPLIHTLLLAHNGLSLLQPATALLPSVRDIDLSSQRELFISKAALTGLTSVTHLDLSRTNLHSDALAEFDLGVLATLPSAVAIDLTWNGIQRFVANSLGTQQRNIVRMSICRGNPGAGAALATPGLFAPFVSLRALDGIVSDVSSMTTLSMSNCNISALSVASLAPGILGVTQLDVSNNAITSAADIASIAGAISGGSPIRVLASHNRLTSISGDDLVAAPNLQALDVSFNTIDFISAAAFSETRMPILAEVKLYQNPIEIGFCRQGYINDVASLRGGARLPVCSTCFVGRYCPGTGRSVPCPAGRFGAVAGAVNDSACQQCPPGTYNGVSGQSYVACSLCPVGRASSTAGSVAVETCGVCPAGTYADVPGETVCKPCPPGRYSSSTASFSPGSCIDCPRGRYSTLFAAPAVSNCTMCPPGSTTTLDGANDPSACVRESCDPGSIPDVVVPGTCVQCPLGRYAPLGAPSCQPCPAGSYSASVGSSQCTLCPTGFFLLSTGATSSVSCQACSSSTVCTVDRSGCTPVCGSGALLRDPVSLPAPLRDALATAQRTCSPFNDASVCVACTDSSTQLCVAGLPFPVTSFRHVLDSSAADNRTWSTSTATAAVVPATSHSTCAEFMQSVGQQSHARYMMARTSVLIATLALALLTPAGLAGALYLWKAHAKQLSLVLQIMDLFSSSYIVPPNAPVMNTPHVHGGLLASAFVMIATGLATVLLLRLSIGGFTVRPSLVQGRVFSGQGVTAYVILGGPLGSMLVCPPVVTSDARWVVQSSSDLFSVASDAQRALGSELLRMLREAGTASCVAVIRCASCSLDSADSVQLQVPYAWQSLGLAVRGSEAYAECTPALPLLLSPRSANDTLREVRISMSALAISVTNSSIVRAGVELQLSELTTTAQPPTQLLNVAAAMVTIQLRFDPTPYTLRVDVTRDTDVLSTLLTIVGFVSGLLGAFRFLMRMGQRSRGVCQSVRGKSSAARSDGAPQEVELVDSKQLKGKQTTVVDKVAEPRHGFRNPVWARRSVVQLGSAWDAVSASFRKLGRHHD